MDGPALLDRLSGTCPNLPVIVVTAHSDLEHAVAACQGGAFEYLPKPFDVDEVVDLVKKAARQQGHVPDRSETGEQMKIPSLIGRAPVMQEVYRSIGWLARTSMTVLITGESGTGKELVARALHQHSPRANKPFVVLNTSAIAAELLESELFGHERGSFTGPMRGAPAASNRHTAALSFWTKSATCLRLCRHDCCACSLKASSIAWAASPSSPWTSAS
jgi:two-component system nitrogen regulation response regulator GlnG